MNEISQWIAAIGDLAGRAECSATVMPVLERLQSDDEGIITLAVVGAPNSGKSTLINLLLGRPMLPVTPLPSNAESVIGPTDDEWLRARNLRVIERVGLDVVEDDMPAAIDAALDRADILLLLVDATMPIRRVEPHLLEEANGRGLPIIVAIGKRQMIGDASRDSVRAYVERYVEVASRDASVIELPPTGDDSASLRDAIDAALAKTDVEQTRERSTRHVLRRLVESIAAAADAARAASRASQAEVEAEIGHRKRALELETLNWTALHLELEQRRQRIESEVKAKVDEERHTRLASIRHELQKTNNIRKWWDEDLPILLQRELRYTCVAVSDLVRRALIDDFQWLEREVRSRGGRPSHDVPEPDLGSLSAGALQQPKLVLSDTNRLRVLLGAGASVALILAGRYFDRARIPFASLAVAVIGLPAAEFIVTRTADRDREQVQRQLDRVVAKCESDYVCTVSAKLKAAYGETLAALRSTRDEWQRARLESLTSLVQPRSPSSPDWDAIVRDATRIAAQLGEPVL